MENLILKEGLKAPTFTLIGYDKKEHTLIDCFNKRVILYFYPKDNAAACSQEAADFKNSIKDFNQKDIIIIGISRYSIKSHDIFIAKYNLHFFLLSDKEEIVSNLYGVLKEKTMFGKKYLGIERSTFVINKEGIITNIYRKVKVPEHVENLKCLM